MDTAAAATTTTEVLMRLPRSVRWRIDLGLFVTADDASADLASSQDPLALLQEWNQVTLQQHQERFQQLVEKYVEEEVEVEHQLETSQSPTKPEVTLELDPLTAMVQEQQARETRKAELYLKYRKERARRKRGLKMEPGTPVGDESDGLDHASLQIIEKDLKRLPHPSSTPSFQNDAPQHLEERISFLREILYIYAQEHPAMGYRQGMHEIASYLFFVLELDEQQYPNHPLFQPPLPICFAMLERTLDQLQLAYDASGEQAFQAMSNSILNKIRQNDIVLFNQLTTSPNIPPPPIYCTRWVRLSFSREVIGYENVLKLWDAFFEYPYLMRTLEVCSAARILLLREALLHPESNPIDLLMNVPPLQNITPLTELLSQLMSQKDADEPVHFQPVSPTIPRGPTQPTPTVPARSPLELPTQSISSTNSSDSKKSNFSFSKMRSSLGQKSESLRQKIISTTNEWKQQQPATLYYEQDPAHGHHPLEGGGGNFLQAAGEVIRNHSQRIHKPSEPMTFPDLLHNSMPLPPSPVQHQHEMWSQLLKKRIVTIQEYLMSIESSSQPDLKVPQEVWEAMADVGKVQQELHNYSVNLANQSR